MDVIEKGASWGRHASSRLHSRRTVERRALERVAVAGRLARAIGTRLVALAIVLSCKASASDAPSSAAAPAPALDRTVVELIFDADHGLADGWMDFGYSPHKLAKGAPASLDLAGYGGLILAHPGLSGPFGGLAFRYRAPSSYGDDFLRVQLQSPSGEALAQVQVDRSRGSSQPDGSVLVWLPMSELNPAGKRFERIMFHAWRSVGHEPVLLDGVGLTPAPAKQSRTRKAQFEIDCGQGRSISPLIYGVGGPMGGPAISPWSTGATARRWGGNLTTRYNWELNTWNLAKDWFFRNAREPLSSYERFVQENLEHKAFTALTVPMIGWVAKDERSVSFPVSVYGPQQATAWDLPDAGNGVGRDGKEISPGPPARTSVRSTPEGIERWVRAIREKDKTRGRSVHSYILDNEPMLWSSTHRDVHPEPAGYDELLERTLAYASAIRRADPEAAIAGPAEWGWLAYHYSAKDVAAGVRLRPDRRRHGDVPLIPWYLKKIGENEKSTGTRILDVLDVHFYPMGQGIGNGPHGETDPATAALRIRSTRALWDPSYVDESWINERMAVIPLLRRWVEENHPGLGISLGEWSFGAEGHMSGGLAAAEALGRFGTEGLTSAYYWTSPLEGSPAFWAFRAYRNFDGAGGHFLDTSIRVRPEGELTSLFASTNEDRSRVVAVLLNHDPDSTLDAGVRLLRCGAVAAARGFTYKGGTAGFAPFDPAQRVGAVAATAAPYSITVLDLTLNRMQR